MISDEIGWTGENSLSSWQAEFIVPYSLACSAHLALTDFLQLRKMYVVSRRIAILAWRDDSWLQLR